MRQKAEQEGASPDSRYGRADVHIHSSVGDGMADIPEIVAYVEEKTDLDVIAITDHDEISGSYQARELAAQRGYHFEVVIGSEVTTLNGHLLALFIEKPVPRHQTLERTIDAIHEQGGLCVVPHPMCWLTESVSKRTLERVMNGTGASIYLDGIETVNATIVGRISNKRARRFNGKHGFAETGGSDAHFLRAVGSAFTLFRGKTGEDLRRSLLERTTVARNGRPVKPSEIGLTQIIKQQIRSKGLSLHGMLGNLRENFYEDRPHFPI